jgi:hypothetical protein
MNSSKRKKLLLFSLAAETFLASYGLLLGEQTSIVSILYIVASGIFIISVLLIGPAELPQFRDIKKEIFWKLPLLALIILIAVFITGYWLFKIPLDPDFADMLPVIKVMNERFLHGDWQVIYDPIPAIWNGIRPIYLPAMWLPYAPAVLLKVDIRWVTAISLVFSFSAIIILIRGKKNGIYGWGQIAITIFLFWWVFARNDVHGIVSMSEEGIVILYFVLLSLAIISGNALFMAVAASCCLLSRYSMIGWLIPCVIFLAFRRDYRRLVVFCVTGTICFLLFFLFPFGFRVLDQTIALPSSYVAFAKHVWEFSPEVYWLNLGVAKFYGVHGMKFLHTSLLVLTFAVPLLFMCFCLLQQKWKLYNINLACFKLSLLIFYQFIDVPYGYLFYTSSFVSLVISACLLKV